VPIPTSSFKFIHFKVKGKDIIRFNLDVNIALIIRVKPFEQNQFEIELIRGSAPVNSINDRKQFF